MPSQYKIISNKHIPSNNKTRIKTNQYQFNMKSPLLLFLVFLSLDSCINIEGAETPRLKLNQTEINRVTLNCLDKTIDLNQTDITFLIKKINSAKYVGHYKGIVKNSLTIYSNNQDSSNIRLVDNKFKWDKGASHTFQLDFNENYFKDLCNKAVDNEVETKAKLNIENPVRTIARIFNTYNEYQESTDSAENLDSLQQALKILETSRVSQSDLTLIINVWMYYTVTDFSTVKYTKRVLFAHRDQSIKAVEQRIVNREEWETETGAPYSDLSMLLEELKNPE